MKAKTTSKGSPTIVTGIDTGKIHAIGSSAKCPCDVGTNVGHHKVVSSGVEEQFDGIRSLGDVVPAVKIVNTLEKLENSALHTHKEVALLYSVVSCEGNFAETEKTEVDHQVLSVKHDHAITEGSGGTTRFTCRDEEYTSSEDTTKKSDPGASATLNVVSGLTNNRASITLHSKQKNTFACGTTSNNHDGNNPT